MLMQRGRKRMLAALLLAVGLLLAPALAEAYGDGGGEGRSTDAQAIPFDAIPPSDMVAAFPASIGPTVSLQDLLREREAALESESRSAERDIAILNGIIKGLEAMDWLGQKAQLGLSFVPGVGWCTSVGLSAARGGADAYRDGKNNRDIVQAIVVSGGASALIGKFSPMNADKAYNTARAGFNIARSTANANIRSRAVVVVVSATQRYGLGKYADYEAEQGLNSLMNTVVNRVSAPNQAPAPAYTPSPSFNPMDSAPATNISGGTPDIN